MRTPFSKILPVTALAAAGWAVSIPLWADNRKPGSPAAVPAAENPRAGAGQASAAAGPVSSSKDKDQDQDAPVSGRERRELSKTAGPPSGGADAAMTEDETEPADGATPASESAGGASAPADEGTPAPDGSGAEEDGEENAPPFMPSREQVSRARLNALLPPGSTHRGVYYPSFRPVQPDPNVTDPLTGAPMGVDAPMDFLFKSESVTRLDNDHVQFEQADWVRFEETPAPDGSPRPASRLEIERGVYDLKNQILTTNQPVRIENQRMAINGGTMLHDRVSGLTELNGGARIVFFEEEPAPKTPKAPSSGKAGPSPSAETVPVPPPAAAPVRPAPKSGARPPASRR